jgi:SNF2 family DNA or RNA helicase
MATTKTTGGRRMRDRSALRPAQLRVIDELKQSTGLQLVAGMGFGKSCCVLTALRDLLDEGTIRAAIIIAPVRVALTTWPNEIATWEHIKHTDIAVLAGTLSKRLQLLKEQHEVYVCSIDLLVWLVDALRKFPVDDPRWDFLCIDELSRFKSPRGERAKKLNRFSERFKSVVGITGTPRPNKWEDQYMPVQLISAGTAWNTSGFDAWLKEHCRQKDYHGHQWEVRDDALPYIKRTIDEWTLTIPPSESTDVPFNSGPEFDVVVPLTKAQKDDLASLEEELLIELGAEGTEKLMEDEEVVVALSQATAIGKASQICQGFLYQDGETVQTYSDAKLKALDDLLAGIDGENVIIVYEYRHDFEMLKKHLKGARWVDRAQTDAEFVELIDACRRGEVQYLLAHPANLGHGVDGLQHGFARMVWFQQTWSAEHYEQMLRRIARPGQQKPVFIHRIMADHFLERRRVARVEQKMADQNEFIASLRMI